MQIHTEWLDRVNAKGLSSGRVKEINHYFVSTICTTNAPTGNTRRVYEGGIVRFEHEVEVTRHMADGSYERFFVWNTGREYSR